MLTESERSVVADTISAERANLHMLELRRALAERGSGRRRKALAVASGSHSPRTRLKAAAAVVAPGLVARALRTREGGAWIAAGGTRVDSSGAREVKERRPPPP